MVFSLALAFTLVTVASYGLLYTARTMHWDAADASTHVLASQGSLQDVRRAVAERRSRTGARTHVVTATSSAMGINIDLARLAVADVQLARTRGFASAPIRAAGPEAYVVQRSTPGPSLGPVRAQIRMLILVGGIGAVISGLLLTVMIGRLVLPPLSSLRAIAGAADLADMAPPTDAPNEITEIAHTFRRTVRKLREEREEIERQHAELERMQASLVRASKLASVGRLAAG